MRSLRCGVNGVLWLQGVDKVHGDLGVPGFDKVQGVNWAQGS